MYRCSPARPLTVRPRLARAARAVALATLWLGGSAAGAANPTFGLDQVAERAREVASRPYEDPRGQVPQWLLDLSYDQWRQIRFRPDMAIWKDRKIPFTLQFFHPGLFYDRTVAIHEVDASGVHRIPFSPERFDYGVNEFASRVPQDLGYAGFRLHFPLKRPDYHDELIVFLGATYFRALGRDLGYGLSARGVAIDTALPRGEEFPWFREFWIVRPAPGAREITLFALLDSARVTGAYRVVVTPGEQTRTAVALRLFFREPVEKVGIAPLTSMFLRGENTIDDLLDFRPETHDSDGLLIASGTGEWIWRALDNPERLHVSSFALDHTRGFGLLQRDRNFDHYQDLEARPDLRPSVWVAPEGDWGAGRVELVQIPTRTDVNDNVVAYWVPSRTLPPAGEPLEYAYQLTWYDEDAKWPPAGRAVATRRDRGTYEDAYRVVVDFEGDVLAALPRDAVLQGVVTVGTREGEGELIEQQVIPNGVTGGWRLVFQVRPSGGSPLELRAFLRRGEDVLTETWSYLLEP
jgi:glucans biosynthesis protein